MAYTARLYTIEQVVWRALHLADADENQYRRFLQFAYEGWRELRKGTVKGYEKWVKKTPDAVNRIDFPQDMEEFIALGIPFGGKIWFLTERNDIIATLSEDDEGDDTLDSSDGEGVSLLTVQYENLRATGGVNLYGYFKIDRESQEIIVNATSRDELILVYSTSGIKTDGITYVPNNAHNALVAYILWRDAMGKMRSSADISVVQMRKMEWQEEKMALAKHDMFKNGIIGIRDVLNSTKSLLRR